MKPHLIATRGLPGSGKSTWVRECLSQYPNSYKRVSKDDLRAMLNNNVYTADNEAFVIVARDAIIERALTSGFSVLVDDTNLNPAHISHFRDMVEYINDTSGRAEGDPAEVEMHVQDFTDVPVEECIRRDSLRKKPVGDKVIRGMWERYLKPIPDHLRSGRQ